MRKARVWIGAVLLAAGVAAPVWASEFAGTCRYFSGLAFNDLHTREGSTFRTQLAADCRLAFSILADPEETVAAKAEAGAYLMTLQRYREVLFDMARERYAAGRDARGSAFGRPVAPPVTRSGEILIARVMGLTEHRRSWVAWREARAE